MFNPDKFIEDSVAEIRNKVNGKAIIALSGGVDSSTAAILASKAIGKNLTAVFVDTGFMRKNESEYIRKIFGSRTDMGEFRLVDAKDRFFDALSGVRNPEEKRKIFGKKFIEIFEEVELEEKAKFLLQGTIAPDWIETRGDIKSHHNVALPSGITLEVVEPLHELYKDEVRIVARRLRLPEEISERMPFPGPGLSVRVIGEITKERVNIVREADYIVKEEILNAKIKPWQAFAVILEGKATGVKGDSRDYGHIIALRVVESLDAMTANSMEVDWIVLHKIANRITREVPNVTRVLYDLTNKPPATIEFE